MRRQRRSILIVEKREQRRLRQAEKRQLERLRREQLRDAALAQVSAADPRPTRVGFCLWDQLQAACAECAHFKEHRWR